MTNFVQLQNNDALPLVLSYEQLSSIQRQISEHPNKGFYFLYDYLVETKPKGELNAHDIYLVGHHQPHEKAKIFANFDDHALLKKLNTCKEMQQLVSGVGIFVYSHHTARLNVVFESKRGDTYHQTTISCETDGTEHYVPLDQFNWQAHDDYLHKLSFESENAWAIASVTIVFYTYPPFHYPELTIDEPVQFNSTAYKKMVEKSLMSTGNTTRLKQAIEKAKRGEDVTIAFIGGSITQGAVALPLQNCYAYQAYLRFKSLFGQADKDHIHFIKAGVGGTPSELGMIRYERDVLRAGKAHPDIVIVEFAVNDADDETNGVSYESLVFRALTAINAPAVVLLFNVFFNDWNLQDRLAPIGTQYQLPMVSIKDAVVDQFYTTKEHGHVLSKRQFFYDIYHPSNTGHTIIADCLAYLFEQVAHCNQPTNDIDFNVSSVYGTDFAAIKLIDRITMPDSVTISRGGFSEIDHELQAVELDMNTHTTPQFPYNWSHTSETGTDSFKLNILCKKLLLVFKDSGDNLFGQVDVLLNGQLIKQLNARDVKWNHCHTVLLINNIQTAEHDIEIKMSEGHEHKHFTILGFGVVQ